MTPQEVIAKINSGELVIEQGYTHPADGGKTVSMMLLGAGSSPKEIISSIGSGKDYETVHAWVGDLKNLDYNPGDTIVGEVYGETTEPNGTPFGSSSNTDLPGVNRIVLRPAEGQIHTGKTGTGARINMGAAQFGTTTGTLTPVVVENLEILGDGTNLVRNSVSGMLTLDRCLITCTGSISSALYLAGKTVVKNCIITATDAASFQGVSVLHDASSGPSEFINCTIHGAIVYGLYTTVNGSCRVINCLVTGSGTADYETALLAPESSNNASSDLTAPGHNPVTSVVPADTYVEPTIGASIDLHLKTGAVAISAGLDVGTTYDSYLDIDQYNRHASEVAWDIGAHQFTTS